METWENLDTTTDRRHNFTSQCRDNNSALDIKSSIFERYGSYNEMGYTAIQTL